MFRFQFKGTLEEYKTICHQDLLLYFTGFGVICRRLGPDIENYICIETDSDIMELPKTLEIDYYVPIH